MSLSHDFTDWLTRRKPHTGRLLKEDGFAWNLADWGDFNEKQNLAWQAVNHGASVLSARVDITADVFTLGVNVPAGRRLTVFNRTLSLTEGIYDIDVLRAENGFTGGTEGVQSKLVDDAPDEVQSRLYTGVTIDGAETVKERLFADVGSSAGIDRPAGAPAIEEVIKQYTEDVMFRVTRETGGSDYTVSMLLIAWEADA